MHQFTGKVILILIVISFFLGSLVVALNPKYTLERNVRSNLYYYPSVKVDVKSSPKDDAREEDAGAQGY